MKPEHFVDGLLESFERRFGIPLPGPPGAPDPDSVENQTIRIEPPPSDHCVITLKSRNGAEMATLEGELYTIPAVLGLSSYPRHCTWQPCRISRRLVSTPRVTASFPMQSEIRNTRAPRKSQKWRISSTATDSWSRAQGGLAATSSSSATASARGPLRPSRTMASLNGRAGIGRTKSSSDATPGGCDF